MSDPPFTIEGKKINEPWERRARGPENRAIEGRKQVARTRCWRRPANSESAASSSSSNVDVIVVVESSSISFPRPKTKNPEPSTMLFRGTILSIRSILQQLAIYTSSPIYIKRHSTSVLTPMSQPSSPIYTYAKHSQNKEDEAAARWQFLGECACSRSSWL